MRPIAMLIFGLLFFSVFQFVQASIPAEYNSLAAYGLADAPYGEEDRDWGVAPPPEPMAAASGPTPLAVPGARVIATFRLREMLLTAPPPVVINVIQDARPDNLPGAAWLSGAGVPATASDSPVERLAGKLAALTGGDPSRTIVFFCAAANCGLAYNAAMRAARLGFADIRWYRGGVAAWKTAGLPTEKATHDMW